METHRKTKETAPTWQIPNGNTRENKETAPIVHIFLHRNGHVSQWKWPCFPVEMAMFPGGNDKFPSGNTQVNKEAASIGHILWQKNGQASQWKWTCFLVEIDMFLSGNTQENK